jgi:hypothetical protein
MATLGYCFWCGMDTHDDTCQFCYRHQPAAWGKNSKSNGDMWFMDQLIPYGTVLFLLYLLLWTVAHAVI